MNLHCKECILKEQFTNGYKSYSIKSQLNIFIHVIKISLHLRGTNLLGVQGASLAHCSAIEISLERKKRRREKAK
jgi:hypothetical protein